MSEEATRAIGVGVGVVLGLMAGAVQIGRYLSWQARRR